MEIRKKKIKEVVAFLNLKKNAKWPAYYLSKN